MATSEVPQEPLPALPAVVDLQRSYQAANGGLSSIEGLKSIVVSGEIIDQSGKRLPFKLYRKRPNLMRLQFELDGMTQVTVFDGQAAYRTITYADGRQELSVLSADEEKRLQMNNSIDGPFFELRSRLDLLEVVGQVEIDGGLAYEILVGKDAGSLYRRIWLDSEHYQEVKLSRDIETQAGEVEHEEVYFSDFVKVKDMWVANLIRYESSGQVMQTVKIDRVRANVGLFDSFFRKPKG